MAAFPAAEARHAPTSIRPDLCCIEIDQAATQSAKRTAAGSGVGFIAADLAREELGALLASHPGFRANGGGRAAQPGSLHLARSVLEKLNDSGDLLDGADRAARPMEGEYIALAAAAPPAGRS